MAAAILAAAALFLCLLPQARLELVRIKT